MDRRSRIGTGPRGRRGPALASLLLVAAATSACRSPTRPEPPPRPSTPPHALTRAADDATVALHSGPKALGPYLEQFPLGNLGRRKDLLAAGEERSLHLVQLSLALPPHHHPERKELTYVLTGRGMVRIDGREYPAAPGAAFRIDPGVAHSVHPDEGETLVAIVYYEPPLLDGDDSVPVR